MFWKWEEKLLLFDNNNPFIKDKLDNLHVYNSLHLMQARTGCIYYCERTIIYNNFSSQNTSYNLVLDNYLSQLSLHWYIDFLKQVRQI